MAAKQRNLKHRTRTAQPGMVKSRPSYSIRRKFDERILNIGYWPWPAFLFIWLEGYNGNGFRSELQEIFLEFVLFPDAIFILVSVTLNATKFFLFSGQRTSLSAAFWCGCRVMPTTCTGLKWINTYTCWWRNSPSKQCFVSKRNIYLLSCKVMSL
jgi:hypothetical protein